MIPSAKDLNSNCSPTIRPVDSSLPYGSICISLSFNSATLNEILGDNVATELRTRIDGHAGATRREIVLSVLSVKCVAVVFGGAITAPG